eukprot:3168048-Rhodomonas_salina.1
MAAKSAPGVIIKKVPRDCRKVRSALQRSDLYDWVFFDFGSQCSSFKFFNPSMLEVEASHRHASWQTRRFASGRFENSKNGSSILGYPGTPGTRVRPKSTG